MARGGKKQIVFALIAHGGSDGRIFLSDPKEKEPAFLAPKMLSEIQTALRQSGSNTIVTLSAACYSGNLGPALCRSSDLTITAADHERPSHHAPMIRTGLTYTQYEAFFYHFMSALKRETPDRHRVDADSNSDGIVSYAEAYTYAYAKPLVGVPGKLNRFFDPWTGPEEKPSNAQIFRGKEKPQPPLEGQSLAPCPDRQLQYHFQDYERLIVDLERKGLFEAAERMQKKLRELKSGQK
jgi:hypothetical protein